MSDYIIFSLGLLIITLGAEALLSGASKIASLLGIRPIIIGMTVVSIGTSLPELAVGITAINDGAANIAIGNIAGTNLVNILLILGLSALIMPLPLNLKSLKMEMFVMIFAGFFLLFLCLDGNLSTTDGTLLLVLGLIYIGLLIRDSRRESQEILKEYSEEYQPSTITEKHNIKLWIKNIAWLLIGIAGTIWGADLLIEGATSIARNWGLSDAIIGLTIIAIGTSAPELVTTLVATFKNDRDVAVGNLIGSSITNIFFILGITCLAAPNGLDVSRDILWFDLPLAALVGLVCYPVFRSGHRVSRTEGFFFVLSYLLYLLFLLYYRI